MKPDASWSRRAGSATNSSSRSALTIVFPAPMLWLSSQSANWSARARLLCMGFATEAEKQAFDLLTRLQHVGPKLALAMLSVMSPNELAEAIGRGDIERIDAVQGVGRKVAERVVRELRDKIGELKLAARESHMVPADRSAQVFEEAVSALVNLGYEVAEAKSAVESLDAAAGVETVIRKSLAVLSRQK